MTEKKKATQSMMHSASLFPEFPRLTSLTSAMVSTCLKDLKVLKKAELPVTEVKLLIKLRIY